MERKGLWLKGKHMSVRKRGSEMLNYGLEYSLAKLTWLCCLLDMVYLQSEVNRGKGRLLELERLGAGGRVVSSFHKS